MKRPRSHIAVWPFLLLAVVSALAGHAQKLTGVQNYGVNRPGVVMVRTVFSADVYVNRIRLDERNFNHLLDSLQRVDSSGTVYTPEQKLNIVLDQISGNPNRFFKATLDYIHQPEEITSSGTGFLITGDGYVATNCHLIDRDNAFIRRQFILSAFQQITEANISAFEEAWASKFTEQQRNILYNTYATVYARLFSMQLFELHKEVFVVYGKDSAGMAFTTEIRPAKVIIKGDPMPGKDIAVLKVDGDSTLPTLKIAGDELPKVGEQLFVYGFPGPVTNNNYLAAESAIQPTLTTGIVSAIKRSVQEWPLIQMDANINKGSSGGPVCNDRGEVVGLTTFGSLENSGSLAAGMNFAIPVSILEAYLDSAGISARLSEASKTFSEGVILFEKGFYRDAKEAFEKTAGLNGHYPGVHGYLADCDRFIAEQDKRKASVLRYDLIGVAALSVIAFLFFALLRRRFGKA